MRFQERFFRGMLKSFPSLSLFLSISLSLSLSLSLSVCVCVCFCLSQKLENMRERQRSEQRSESRCFTCGLELAFVRNPHGCSTLRPPLKNCFDCSNDSSPKKSFEQAFLPLLLQRQNHGAKK